MDSITLIYTFVIGIFAGMVFMYALHARAAKRKRNISDAKFLRPVNEAERNTNEFFHGPRN